MQWHTRTETYCVHFTLHVIFGLPESNSLYVSRHFFFKKKTLLNLLQLKWSMLRYCKQRDISFYTYSSNFLILQNFTHHNLKTRVFNLGDAPFARVLRSCFPFRLPLLSIIYESQVLTLCVRFSRPNSFASSLHTPNFSWAWQIFLFPFHSSFSPVKHGRLQHYKEQCCNNKDSQIWPAKKSVFQELKM